MSTHWVSEFGEEVDDEHRTTLNSFDQSHPSAADNNKKRKPTSIDDEKERNKRRQNAGYERSSSIC
jgi:hypothetical protein